MKTKNNMAKIKNLKKSKIPSQVNSDTKQNWKKEWQKKFFEFQEMGCIKDSDEMIPFIEKLLLETYKQGFEDGVLCPKKRSLKVVKRLK